VLFELSIILLLIGVNGVFAGAEISIISVRRSRLQQLVEEGRAGARAVQALRSFPERFLATVQVGITVVGATAAAFSGASLSSRLASAFEGLGWSAESSREVALAAVIAAISYLSIIFGELVPKSLALRSGERYALLMARPLQALAWLGRPLVWLLTASSNLVLKPFGDATSFTEARLSTEELRQLVEEAAETGSLDARSSEIAARALDFGDLTAAAVMVPRNRVVAVPLASGQAALRTVVLAARFSRMPVFDGTLDNVVGYITMRDVLALAWLGRPLVWLLTASSNLVLKPFGDATSFTEARLSTEELRQLVEEAAETGSLDARSSEIAARALDFGDLTAAAVMVPRNRVVAMPLASGQAELRKVVLAARFSRMPVFDGTLDNVVGYITMRDVLALAWDREEVVLADILRPAFFVPETTGAGRVLQEMQRRRVPIAIVVDEHGGVAGLITLEDLVEELVGDLASEDERAGQALRVEPDGSALLEGSVAIRDVNRELGLDLPEGEGWTTIAGLCIELTGGIPQPGSRVEVGGRVLEIVEASARSVGRVRVTLATPSGPE
jgi:putative hemolysin